MVKKPRWGSLEHTSVVVCALAHIQRIFWPEFHPAVGLRPGCDDLGMLQETGVCEELRGRVVKQAVKGFERFFMAILFKFSDPGLDCRRPLPRIGARIGFDGRRRTITVLFLDEFDFGLHGVVCWCAGRARTCQGLT